MVERREMEGNGNVIDPEVNASAAPKASTKRRREEGADVSTGAKKAKLPDGFLDFLPLEERKPTRIAKGPKTLVEDDKPVERGCRQFWKAGEYEGNVELQTSTVGMDHVRVHPKFLHANATSHKWALGAIAELLDNAIDEIPNEATFVNIEVIKNPADGTSPMLLFQDDGGGMTGDRMRKCLSFGYSEKTKCANTVGQYGNGFKTSTMRLGADVIVFSKSKAKEGRNATRSIGLLSWTFLTQTGQQDLMVPMLHYEVDGGVRNRLTGSEDEYNRNLKTITKWSPYRTEESLKNEFKKIKSQGTRILIFNLWEDDQKRLELDFETDPQDIQLRGREKNIDELAKQYPSARHYYLYRYSLRVYASILYRRLPGYFKIMLRGEAVPLHDIVSKDLIYIQKVTYKPQVSQEALETNPNANNAVSVTVGFLKDAESHIDVQGFNVYHRNRLIKPFWIIWHPGSSQGRGVIGVLEANFVQPAHDKQGFERTLYLQRLESRLKLMQKDYWHKNCDKIGYAAPKTKSARKGKKKISDVSSEEIEVDMEVEEEEIEQIPVSVTPRAKSHSKKDDEEPRTDYSLRSKLRTTVNDEEPQTDSSRKLAVLSTVDGDEPPARRFKVTAAKRTARKASPVPLQALRDEQPPAYQATANEESPELDMVDIEDRVRVNELAQSHEMITSRLDKLEQTDAAKNSSLELAAVVHRLQEEKAELEARLEVEKTQWEARLEIEKARVEAERLRSSQLEEELAKMEDELRSLTSGLVQERDMYKDELTEEKKKLEEERKKLELYISAAQEERNQRDTDDELLRTQLKNALRRQRELEDLLKKK